MNQSWYKLGEFRRNCDNLLLLLKSTTYGTPQPQLNSPGGLRIHGWKKCGSYLDHLLFVSRCLGKGHELFEGFVGGKHEGQHAIHVGDRLLPWILGIEIQSDNPTTRVASPYIRVTQEQHNLSEKIAVYILAILLHIQLQEHCGISMNFWIRVPVYFWQHMCHIEQWKKGPGHFFCCPSSIVY